MSRIGRANNAAIVLAYVASLIALSIVFGLFIDKRFQFLLYVAVAASFVVYVVLLRSKVSASLEVLYMKGNAEDVLNYLNRTLRFSIRRRFMLPYARSIALSYFGKFEEAKAEIDTMSTDRMVPLYEGMRQNALAIYHYLGGTDPQSGLRCSMNAKELADVGKAVPGRKVAQNTYEAYVEIGMVVTGKAKESTVRSLEGRFERSMFLLKLPIAWALGSYYRNRKKDEFDKYDDFLTRKAPSCRRLREYKTTP